MIIDLLDYQLKVESLTGKRLTQGALSKICSVNRYTINMALNNEDKDGCYNMPPDKAVKLWHAYPDAIKLPEIFFYYSVPSFVATRKILGIQMAEVAKRHNMPTSTLNSIIARGNFFIYDNKEIFDDFSEIYYPVMDDAIAMSFSEDGISEKKIIEEIRKGIEDIGSATKEEFEINMALRRINERSLTRFIKDLPLDVRKKYEELDESKRMGLLLKGFNEIYQVGKVKNAKKA